jgi:hypothetical protein
MQQLATRSDHKEKKKNNPERIAWTEKAWAF